MPTAEYFAQIPSFPDDVPIANIPRISLSKLQAKDVAASQSLFEAATDTGFFLLDLNGSPTGDHLLKETETAFETSKAFYGCSLEEKSKFPMLPSNLGYKEPGRTKVENDKPDRCEIFGLAQDDLLGHIPPYDKPAAFEDSRAALTSCTSNMHEVASTLLSNLDNHLDLPPGTLASWHSSATQSPSCLRFLHMPPQPVSDQQTSLLGHTDNGSITILFNVVGGLQILPPNETEWRYVRPEPGCAIVNFGDTMTQWTGGVLRSNMHRVVPPPGAQAACERYSFAYVLKPSNDARMDRWSEGDVIPRLRDGEPDLGDCTYGEFHKSKSAAIKAGKNVVGARLGGKAENMIGVDVQEVNNVH